MHIVVNLDKPSGMSSQEAVTAVKKIFKCRKAGHAGTLDPLATGILIVCLNEATKIAGYIAGLDKEYIMTGRLGLNTDTYDSEGAVTYESDYSSITEADLLKTLNTFLGEQDQIPPIYSAIKKNGEPLYKLARKGETPEVQPRRVRMDEIQLLSFDTPSFTIRVKSSKGTYMRSLCFDIGKKLGCGAHMTKLMRTSTGIFSINSSATLSELPEKTSALMDIDRALGCMKELIVEADSMKLAKNGNPLSVPAESGFEPGTPIKLKSPSGSVFGIAKATENSIKIERLFNI